MSFYDPYLQQRKTKITCRTCNQEKRPEAFPRNRSNAEAEKDEDTPQSRVCTSCYTEAHPVTPPPWQSPFYRTCPKCEQEQRNTQFPSITQQHQTDFCRTCIAAENAKPEGQRNRRKCDECNRWKGPKSFSSKNETCSHCKKKIKDASCT